MPFWFGINVTVASHILPTQQGIRSLRQALATYLIGGSRMRLTTRSRYVSLLAVGVLAVAAAPTAANAADSEVSKACTVTPASITYTGHNYLYYYRYNSTYFNLDYDTYNFGPANSNSTNNNQNLYFYGGSAGDTETSKDNLVRDGKTHTDETTSNWGSISGEVGHSYATFTDIFDVPSYADPSCKATTSYF